MKITDLKSDARNANKGTERGSAAIEASLRRFGAGRSILIDKNGAIIAGNKTAENAQAAGLEDVIVVPSDGTKLVAVQRTDLDITDPKARELAVADNRTGELSLEWDASTLSELSGDLDLEPFFTGDELAELVLPEGAPVTGAPEPPEGRYREQYGVIVICQDEADQRQVYERLTNQGLECRVVVT
jgi:sporulation protein YlmC with PRC-barrel domain